MKIPFGAVAAAQLVLGACAPAAALTPPLPDWVSRVHLGGNGAVRFSDGQSRAQLERNSGFGVFQAGFVADVDLAENMSFWYDFNLIREGQDRSTFREQIYLRWDRLLGFDWLNAKLGRAFTPFGEDYLRWNQIDNPAASMTTAFPWALDEGVVLFGELLPGGRLGYAAAVQNGNNNFNFDDNANKALALKLGSQGRPWLYGSVSYLYFGKQRRHLPSGKGETEFWLSGFNIEPLGTTSAASGASPSTTVDGQAVEADLILSRKDLGRAWLSGGYLYANDGGGDEFDRIIRWFTGELLGEIPRTAGKLYGLARYSVVGTFSPALGYRFAGTEIAIPPAFTEANTSPYSGFNYDQRDLYRYTLGLGYRHTENILAKLEYSWEGSHLIEPAKTPANLAQRGRRDFFIAEAAFRF